MRDHARDRRLERLRAVLADRKRIDPTGYHLAMVALMAQELRQRVTQGGLSPELAEISGILGDNVRGLMRRTEMAGAASDEIIVHARRVRQVEIEIRDEQESTNKSIREARVNPGGNKRRRS